MSVDIATLGLAVESDEVMTAEQRLERLKAAAKRAEAAAGGTTAAGRRLHETLTKTSGAAERARRAMSVAFEGMSRAATRAAGVVSDVFRRAFTYLKYAGLGALAAMSVAFAAIVREVQPIKGEIASLQDYLGAAWDAFSSKAQTSMADAVRWTLQAAANIAQAMSHAYTQAKTVWGRLPGVMSEAVTGAANSVIASVESMVNAAILRINTLIDLVNYVPGVNIGHIGAANFGRYKDENAGALAALREELAAHSAANAERNLFEDWRAAANKRAWSNSTTVKAGSTKAEVSELEKLIAQMRERSLEYQHETNVIGMSTFASERYLNMQKLVQAAIKDGVPLTDERLRSLQQEADDLARNTAAYENSMEAFQRMNDMRGTFQSTFSTFAQDIAKGTSALDSLASALSRVADKLIDMAANSLFDNAFGKQGTSNSFFGNLANGNAAGGLLGGVLVPGILHNGGVVGNDNYPHRAVAASTFANAPRYHNGGVAGLKPNEVPAILERGEVVIPKGRAGQRGGGGGSAPVINVNIDATGADVAAISRLEGALMQFKREVPRMVKEIYVEDRDRLRA